MIEKKAGKNKSHLILYSVIGVVALVVITSLVLFFYFSDEEKFSESELFADCGIVNSEDMAQMFIEENSEPPQDIKDKLSCMHENIRKCFPSNLTFQTGDKYSKWTIVESGENFCKIRLDSTEATFTGYNEIECNFDKGRMEEIFENPADYNISDGEKWKMSFVFYFLTAMKLSFWNENEPNIIDSNGQNTANCVAFGKSETAVKNNYCGNGKCDIGETPTKCPADCKSSTSGGGGGGGGGGTTTTTPITSTCTNECTSGGCDGNESYWCLMQSDGCYDKFFRQNCANDGKICSSGSCVAISCSPSCTGKECGDDGCGGTCLPGCGSGEVCNASGGCEELIVSGVITSCGVVISTPGEYSVANDLIAMSSNQECIIVNDDNVKIDCNGNSIIGLSKGGGSGIYANGFDNLSINNCFIENFLRGILINKSSNLNITNSQAKRNYFGLSQFYTKDFQISNSNFLSNYAGVYFYESQGGAIINSTFENNSWAGIDIYDSDNIVFEDCLVNHNNWGVLSSYTISFGYDSTSNNISVIRTSIAHNNHGLDIRGEGNKVVEDSLICNNTNNSEISLGKNNTCDILGYGCVRSCGGTCSPGIEGCEETGLIEISSCGITISEPGKYFLTDNITGTSTEDCISISADNVDLNCRGYWIKDSKRGIEILSSAFTNVSNCNIYHSFEEGFYMSSSDNSNVNKIISQFNGYDGFVVRYSSNNSFSELRGIDNGWGEDSIGLNMFYGLYMLYSHNNNLTNSSFNNNSWVGVLLEHSDFNYLEEFVSKYNLYIGLRVISSSDNNTIKQFDSTYNKGQNSIYFGHIEVIGSRNNNLISVNSSHNQVQQYAVGYGIYIKDSNNIEILNSFVCCNEDYSIYKEGFGIRVRNSSATKIIGSEIYNNTAGVYLQTESYVKNTISCLNEKKDFACYSDPSEFTNNTCSGTCGGFACTYPCPVVVQANSEEFLSVEETEEPFITSVWNLFKGTGNIIRKITGNLIKKL